MIVGAPRWCTDRASRAHATVTAVGDQADRSSSSTFTEDLDDRVTDNRSGSLDAGAFRITI